MNRLKKLALSVASVTTLVVVIGLFLPRTAHVERSATIAAPPAMVFTVLNGFRQFDKWSPWARLDPQATTKLEGPATGVGAKMSWAGNRKVGTGGQEIVESVPFSRIKVRLTFGDVGGDFFATYALAPEGAGTALTWSFNGDYGSSVIGRYFGLLSDHMLGPDYDKGLAQLKAFVEGMPKGDFSALKIEAVETQDDPIVFLPIHSLDEPRSIGLGVGVACSRLQGYISAQRVKQLGPPVAIFRSRAGNTLQIDAAIPVDRIDTPPRDDVRGGRLPAGHAIKGQYRGSYLGLAAARQQMLAYLSTAGLQQDGPNWEQYVSDPGKTAEADLITDLYYPIR